MQEKLSEIKASVLPAVEKATTLAELDAVRVGVVGKNGTLTAMMKYWNGQGGNRQMKRPWICIDFWIIGCMVA